MTAATTPRLGLLSPTNSDDFLPEDFVNTMTKLDGRPGVLPVANYAALNALTSSLTSAQSDCLFVTSDTGAMWQWVKPGSSAGQMRRVNTTTFLQETLQTSQMSTTVTTPAAGPIVVQNQFAFPGGRNMRAEFQGNINNSADTPAFVVELFVSYSGTTTTLASGSYTPNAAGRGNYAHVVRYLGLAIPPGTPTNVFARIRSVNGVGGTTLLGANTGRILVYEI